MPGIAYEWLLNHIKSLFFTFYFLTHAAQMGLVLCARVTAKIIMLSPLFSGKTTVLHLILRNNFHHLPGASVFHRKFPVTRFFFFFFLALPNAVEFITF